MKQYSSSHWKSMKFSFYHNFIHSTSQQVVNDVIYQQLRERYFSIKANWLITWNTIPSNHFHRGHDFQLPVSVDFRHPRLLIDSGEKWWYNVIRWLNWWHNKRLYKLIMDSDVITKLWLSLCFISYQFRKIFFPLDTKAMKTSVEHFQKQTRGGEPKHIFHSIQS